MKPISLALFTALAWSAVYGVTLADQPSRAPDADKSKAKSPEGMGVFQKYKCRSCHSIESQGITKKEAEAETEKTEKKPPDLSGIGLDKKADWFVLFLQKKEKLDGELHPKKFRGTDTELKKLATWLEALKEKPKGEKKPDESE